MAEGLVEFRLDARQFRQDMSDLLERKAKGITTDTELYHDVMMILKDYLTGMVDMVDTGALKYQADGESDKTGYFREGYFAANRSHGLSWDAYEQRPNGAHHYVEAVVSGILGISGEVDSEALRDAMIGNGTWNSFLEDCKPYIIEAMNRA